jgi:hypothetical protein
MVLNYPCRFENVGWSLTQDMFHIFPFHQIKSIYKHSIIYFYYLKCIQYLLMYHSDKKANEIDNVLVSAELMVLQIKRNDGIELYHKS